MAYEVHPIEEIVGIGPRKGALFREADITVTEDLLRFSSRRIFGSLPDSDLVSISAISKYRSQGELLQIGGMDGTLSRLCHRVGRETLSDFAAPSPGELLAELEAAAEEPATTEDMDEAKVAKWQKEALRIESSPAIFLRVTTLGESPVDGASVYFENSRSVTNQEGKAWLPITPKSSFSCVVRAGGHKRKVEVLSPVLDHVTTCELALEPGTDASVRIDEREAGFVSARYPDDRVVFDDADVSGVETGAHYFVQRTDLRGDRARLLSVHRTRLGNEIHVDRVDVERSLVPTDVEDGTVISYNGERFESTEETVGELRLSMYNRRLSDIVPDFELAVLGGEN